MTAIGPGLTQFVVVMPVYEDREAASRLMKNLQQEYGGAVTVVAVDDGSVRPELRRRPHAGLPVHDRHGF